MIEPRHELGEKPGEPQTAAAIATTVGTVLAQSAQVNTTEDAAEIKAITDAMVRLLVGIPLRSDGQLTVKSLAEEAGLKRNKLTHKHTGMKDLFYALVKSQDSRPRIADELHQRNVELKKKLKKASEARAALDEQVKQLVRVVHVLEVENHQLRKSAEEGGVIRALPTARRNSASRVPQT
ncbi:hypothetical protein AB0C61_16295 [Streptomyces sp. NPDC048680]|uniref:hypothetical protein n=1 Tax=Streptomyces sp. NPDC048680 TaxID=3155492 RepID=UPI00343401D4